MPNTGTGTGSPITVPAGGVTSPSLALPPAWPNTAVSLVDYQQYVQYDEPAFWGVTYDGQEELACNQLWKGWQRSQLANALAEAQSMIEGVCGFPLYPTWIEDEQVFAKNPILTKYVYLLEAGKQAFSDIALGETIDYTSEPATVGPIATSVTNQREIHFYIQGTDCEVFPSSVTLSGGFLNAEFPRSRLVLPTYDTLNSWTGNRFTDTLNFAGELDIKREYADTTVTTTLYRRDDNCAIESEQLCIRIENTGLGIVRVYRDCSVAASVCSCNPAYGLKLFYRAGLQTLDPKVKSAVIRLAHTLIPTSLCNQCDQIHNMWANDNHVPQGLTRERQNCPFGLSDGAWFSYKQAQRMKVYRMRSF